MNVLVLGATGFLGGGVAARLVASGHAVTGLARSAESAARLQAVGIAALHGDLEGDLEPVLQATEQSDAVIFAPQLLLEPEHQTVSALLDRMAGGDWSQDSFAETDAFTPARTLVRRVETEDLVRAAVSRGVRGIVIRPPLVWGPGDHGHIASIYRSVARTGAACYVGSGLNCYSNVHIEDLTRLYELALERGTPGALYHAVAGEISNRWIAECVARDLGCPTRSLTVEEAFDVWGKFATLIVMAASSRSRSPRAREDLGWTPVHLDMLSQIGEPRLRALAAP